MTQFTVAVAQLDSKSNKDQNIQQILSFIDEAVKQNADLVAFPEMATYMGDVNQYSIVAEEFPGPTIHTLAEKARDHGIYVHIGSFFESIPNSSRVYNTSGIIGPDGDLLDIYRKIHLFDITGEVEYHESDTVAPGEQITTIQTEIGTFGLSICYDLRFPQLYRSLAMRGADVLFVPAAFTLHTGKDHWEPLLRARAIENQIYVVAPAQIGDKTDSIHTYGKSLVVDPWGNVIAKASDREEIFTATIDLDCLEETRNQLQTLSHIRSGIYE